MGCYFGFSSTQFFAPEGKKNSLIEEVHATKQNGMSAMYQAPNKQETKANQKEEEMRPEHGGQQKKRRMRKKKEDLR